MDKGMKGHNPDCDVNDINPDGIVKPCNCGADPIAVILQDLDSVISTARKRYEDDTDYEWRRNQGFIIEGLRAARIIVEAHRIIANKSK